MVSINVVCVPHQDPMVEVVQFLLSYPPTERNERNVVNDIEKMILCVKGTVQKEKILSGKVG